MNSAISRLLREFSFHACIGLLIAAPAAGAAPSFSEDTEIAGILKKHGATGTVLIASLDGKAAYVHNPKRARRRLSPASTFKIPNSLIAIEEGVLKDQREIIPWDGKKRFFDAWNRDHHLKSAFRKSCVWFYQELAKRIGKKKYLEYLARLNYGNRLLGKDVTTFWLEGEGDLRISPLEQMDFLKRTYARELPLSDRAFDILKDIMLEESHKRYRLYSKTGAATKGWVGHGWYVGYVETQGRVWFFVTNILIDGKKDLKKRKAVTLDALKKKGAL